MEVVQESETSERTVTQFMDDRLGLEGVYDLNLRGYMDESSLECRRQRIADVVTHLRLTYRRMIHNHPRDVTEWMRVQDVQERETLIGPEMDTNTRQRITQRLTTDIWITYVFTYPSH
jgi:hypothetical protein